MFTEIGKGIFAAGHSHVEGETGIVFGRTKAMAVDSGNLPEDGVAIAGFIRSKERSPRWLAFTHGHGDHIWGSRSFAESEVIAHTLTKKVMEQIILEATSGNDELSRRLTREVVWPTVVFTEECAVDLGGREVRLLHTPGHTRDSISLFVEQDGILFAGDSVFSGIVPAIGTIGGGHSEELEATLKRLIGWEAQVLVPGHGPVLVGKAQVKKCLQSLIGYLESIRHPIKQMISRGYDAHRIEREIPFDGFAGRYFSPEKHHMVERHRDVVRRIIEEQIGPYP